MVSLCDIMDVSTLEKLIDSGYISRKTHPSANLFILNYTAKAQYEKLWTRETTQSRGLIVDGNGLIVARPFPKFFNLSEHVGQDLPVPAELPIVTEKMDGSLAILYWLNNEPWIATRGSFTSTQAQWATQWLRAALPCMSHDKRDALRNPGVTHLFEIICPLSRVVVRYDYEGLVHLATLDNATGCDAAMPYFPSLHYPKRLLPHETDLAVIQARDETNAEGYVALFPASGLRVKCKFSTYVKWHKILTGLSQKGIWELLKDGADLSQYLENVPDEWMAWFTDTKGALVRQYATIQAELDDWWYALTADWHAKGYTKERDRKAIAFDIVATPYPSMLFARLDGKTYDHKLWKMIEPKGARTFHEDGENE